jgi:hypothetical protein
VSCRRPSPTTRPRSSPTHYATPYFIVISPSTESPLTLLDLIHVFVESLDYLFEDVCELDLIFNFETLHAVLGEMIVSEVVVKVGREKVVEGFKAQGKVLNVQYSSRAGVNLLSLDNLWPFIDGMEKLQNGLAFTQGRQRFSANIAESLMMLYTWECPTTPIRDFQGAAYSIKDPSIRLWHERMHHLSKSGPKCLRHIATGMDDAQEDCWCMCEPCVKGRMTERPHTGVIAPGRHPRDLIHTDVAGPIEVTGHDQSRY